MVTPKTISLAAAMTLLVESKERMVVEGKEVRAVQIPIPFSLIVVENGTQGSVADADDWIVWHPQGYPFIVTDGVVQSQRSTP